MARGSARRRLTLGAGLLALVLSGCAGASADAPTPTPTAASGPATTVPPLPGPSASGTPSRPSSPAATPAPAPSPPELGTALATLGSIPVKGRAAKSGYDRDRFGQAWADVDRNGCDTRNDILRRDLSAVTLKRGTRGCVVLSGTLHDPYTGRTLAFVRGARTSGAVQVDHVVALSDAWQKGAQRWDEATRTAFANDPLNLLAVDGPTNAAKGDGDTATWLPPRKAARCGYVARQVAVKSRYRLWMTAAERAAAERVLGGCPGQAVPTTRPVALGGAPEEPEPAPSHRATPRPVSSGRTPDPRFGSCRAALAAGYGPYVEGRDVEYGWYRDGDSDGTVCE
ncbi:calcium-binding protein [Phycicoccus sp. DTK01]|nr:calcium-binding protein [Phycicoccus sp. DTK01]